MITLSYLSIAIIIITIIDISMYIPMLLDLINNPKETSKNINLSTWIWWSISSALFALYFHLEVKDLLATIASLMHFVGCSITVITVLYFRKRQY